MKKLYLFVLLLLPISLLAETNGEIVPVKGAVMKAEILRVTKQQVYFMLPNEKYVSVKSSGEIQRIIIIDSLDIRVKNKQFYDFGNKIEEPADGIFYVMPNGEEKLGKAQVMQVQYESDEQFNKELQNKRQADPNYAIGHALLCTGGVTLGVGVPCVITGSILYVFSKKDLSNEEKKNEKTIKEAAEKRSDMASAGCIIAGAGAALSIVSIPLIIEGKKIVDLSLQISENGAGVAVKF